MFEKVFDGSVCSLFHALWIIKIGVGFVQDYLWLEFEVFHDIPESTQNVYNKIVECLKPPFLQEIDIESVKYIIEMIDLKMIQPAVGLDDPDYDAFAIDVCKRINVRLQNEYVFVSQRGLSCEICFTSGHNLICISPVNEHRCRRCLNRN